MDVGSTYWCRSLKLVVIFCFLSFVSAPAVLAGGDPALGEKTAALWCAACHQIAPEFPPKSPAPPFMEIGRNLKYSRQYLSDWITYPHSEMPNFQFSPEVLENLVSYILSFQEDPVLSFQEDPVAGRFGASLNMESVQFASGSGFFVTRKGHILTAAHLLENCDHVTVAIPGRGGASGGAASVRSVSRSSPFEDGFRSRNHRAVRG